MRILITGGTGFIGAHLCGQLLEAGHQLVVFSRRPEQVESLCGQAVEAIGSLDEITPQSEFDAVINLAGEPIADKRWSARRKQLLMESRLETTRKLVQAVAAMHRPPSCLINASAVGFYGDQGDRPVDESTLPHEEFSHELCRLWEQAANKAAEYGVRVCIVRIGLVVGPGGGFVSRMLPAFKLGLGGPLGNGRQWMSWVHRSDLVRLFEWLLTHDQAQGVYNGTAPNPVTNREFTRTLAKVLHRPACLPMPAFAAKALFGEMSRLLLTGQRVYPKRVTDAGFEFNYPQLQAALESVLP
ncbi:MAG: TIGR01777 family oxidoreductase [Pseudomonadales bacterium]